MTPGRTSRALAVGVPGQTKAFCRPAGCPKGFQKLDVILSHVPSLLPKMNDAFSSGALVSVIASMARRWANLRNRSCRIASMR